VILICRALNVSDSNPPRIIPGSTSAQKRDYDEARRRVLKRTGPFKLGVGEQLHMLVEAGSTPWQEYLRRSHYRSFSWSEYCGSDFRGIRASEGRLSPPRSSDCRLDRGKLEVKIAMGHIAAAGL
jgi:hypothetical protein